MSTTLTPSMRRSMLIAALRDPSMWPPGFEWCFDNCQSCAMGLLVKTLKIDPRQDTGNYTQQTAKLLGISISMARDIFHTPAYYVAAFEVVEKQRDAFTAVTPAMIADRLERAHAELSAVEAEQASSK